MTQSDTPRTDAARNYKADVVARNARLIDLAERLERELARVDGYDRYCEGEIKRLERELAEVLAERDSLAKDVAHIHSEMLESDQRAERAEVELAALREEIVVQGRRAIKAEDELAEARNQLSAALNLLLRLKQWDMMDQAADGAYWKKEIAAIDAARREP